MLFNSITTQKVACICQIRFVDVLPENSDSLLSVLHPEVDEAVHNQGLYWKIQEKSGKVCDFLRNPQLEPLSPLPLLVLQQNILKVDS